MEKRKWEQKDYEYGMPLLLHWWNYADFAMWAIMVKETLLPSQAISFYLLMLPTHLFNFNEPNLLFEYWISKK